jgi:CheY-like chemotaxis protein
MDRAASGSSDAGSVDPEAPVEPQVLHLLHVEDNAADAMLMQAYLSDVLPQVRFDSVVRLSALSPERAQAADCALLDLSLPDASGLEALVALRALSDTLPIIVLTGYDNTELGLAAVRDGADDYLIKNDVDGPKLARTITYSIERRRRMIELARSEVSAAVQAKTSAPGGPVGDPGPVDEAHEQRSVAPAIPAEHAGSAPGQAAPAHAAPVQPARVLPSAATVLADPSTTTTTTAAAARREAAKEAALDALPLGPDAETAAAAVVSRRGMLRPRRWLAVASGDGRDVPGSD